MWDVDELGVGGASKVARNSSAIVKALSRTCGGSLSTRPLSFGSDEKYPLLVKAGGGGR